MYSSVLLFFSGSDLMVIMFIALLLFGGEKLPELARGLGKGIRDFKDASEGVKREINNQINSYEEKKAEETTANSAPVTTQPALPPAEEHVASATGNTEETHAGVANTMPFAENNNITSEQHASETPLNPHEESTEASAEPVKTTHE
jgi:sec-independent protein translocase protein TatA